MSANHYPKSAIFRRHALCGIPLNAQLLATLLCLNESRTSHL